MAQTGIRASSDVIAGYKTDCGVIVAPVSRLDRTSTNGGVFPAINVSAETIPNLGDLR